MPAYIDKEMTGLLIMQILEATFAIKVHEYIHTILPFKGIYLLKMSFVDHSTVTV